MKQRTVAQQIEWIPKAWNTAFAAIEGSDGSQEEDPLGESGAKLMEAAEAEVSILFAKLATSQIAEVRHPRSGGVFTMGVEDPKALELEVVVAGGDVWQVTIRPMVVRMAENEED